jgi:[acyl-carrier-protein] S-malonyltransferase
MGIGVSKIGFLFPGQGAQFVGMGRALADSLPAAKQVFDQANEVLGYDLASLCFEGPEDQLNATDHCQPALFVTSMAALEQLKVDTPEVLDQCVLSAGLSLGEYSAICFSGALSFEDALRVVQCRGQAMQAASDAHPSGMVAVLGMEVARIEELCDQAREDDVLQVANLLCPGNIACSGDNAACERLAALATEAGAMKVIPLTVAGAFHTSLMQSAVERLREALEQVEIKAPRIPVVSNVDAQPHTDPEEIRELLIKQVVNPVRWEESIGTMLQAGVEQFYEIGAGKVLRGLLKRINRKIPINSVP